MINRLINFLKWYKYEYSGKASTQETYEMISKDLNYDKTIDFTERKIALSNLFSINDIKDKKILDLACGTGAFISAVIDKNPKKIVGVDLTEGMLNIARKRFVNDKRITFINKSFMDVDFKEGSFDLILLANASRYIPFGEEKRFFTNIRRWLKKDSVFVIHSDFWGGSFGKLMAPIIKLVTNKKYLNPNTTFDWTLEKELHKYFSIFKKEYIKEITGASMHLAFFCKTNNQKS